MDYMSTDFGVYSSSHFRFRAWANRRTDKQTDATERPTPDAGGYTASVGNQTSNSLTEILLCF